MFEMVKNIPVLYLFILLITVSCNVDDSSFYLMETRDTISVNPDNITTKKVQYSNLFSKIDYIVPPTDKNFLIGRVDKLVITDSCLFILDEKISHGVYGIDRLGNRILVIQRLGSAPGEYSVLSDLVYDSESRSLVLYCRGRGYLLYYDLNGKFLHEEKIPYDVRCIHPIGKQIACYAEYHDNKKLRKEGFSPNVILYNPEQGASVVERIAYFRPPISQYVIWHADCQFSNWEDTLSIKPDHHNIVYHIIANKILPAHFLDFKEYNIDKRYWDEVKGNRKDFEYMDGFVNREGLCETVWYLEGDNYIYFAYRRKKKMYDVIYSKKTKKMHHIMNYDNDMDHVTNFRPIAIHNDKFYCLVDSDILWKIKQQGEKGYIPDSVMSKVQEYGNPMIAIFTLKPF